MRPLKEHYIYQPRPASGGNFDRAPPPLCLQIGSPPIVRQQKPASVTLHLGTVLSALWEAHPRRRSSGLPLSRCVPVTKIPIIHIFVMVFLFFFLHIDIYRIIIYHYLKFI